ncbi:hypothetical protein PENTCL1PPCAC_14629, partial [Pristionchus entomophagus]
MRVFISIDEERRIVSSQHSLFVISTFFNIIALGCVIKQTPPHMAEFRKYLLLIQAYLFLMLIGLFPVPAVYCVGLLCQFGVPIHAQFAVMMFMLLNVTNAVAICIFFRHQALLLGNHPLKLKQFLLVIMTSGLVLFLHMFYELYSQ